MAQANGAHTPDALDAVDYDPMDHLNALFTHQSTLSSAPAISHRLRQHQTHLSHDISTLTAAQTANDASSIARIQTAKAELQQLFAKIETVRARALETERTITAMTTDIKTLDSTKRNLTLSMTALKRLQMLTTAYEQLRSLSKTRQYGECAQLLQAVLQLMAHFRSYRSVEQIAALSRNVAELQRELLEQVCEDFEVVFAKGEVGAKRAMLAEACGVVDALGEHARARVVNWYCNTQLREYRRVFRGNEEAGGLDNIGRRYSWFLRLLKTFETEHAGVFPRDWRVDEQLANAFCEGTREDYKGILQRSMRGQDGKAPDVGLLLGCLQETLDFEHALERRFAQAAGESRRSSLETTTSSSGVGEERRQGFSQAISEAFEPYLSLWVESQDRQLGSLIPKYREQPIRNPDEEFHAQLVVPSSTELFHHYRITLAQCAKLSTGGRLLELTTTFAKYLDAYSQQVLFHFFGEKSGSQGPSVEDTVIILNTADYCYQTTNQLEEKIRLRIDEELREKVDFQSQADSFMGIASAAVRALVHKAELDCEPAWREMRSIPWAKLESVGDASPYIYTLDSRIKERSKEILQYLSSNKPQYARAYCDNLLDSLVNNYITCIVAARPISETGAEQMLLDSYSLKKNLTTLPTLTAEAGTPPNAAFTKRINASTATKLDPILKTLQVRASPPEGLVQAYLIHIRDKSEPNFRKLLDIKGLTRRQDQSHLLELFNAHKASPANSDLQASNSVVAALNLNAATTASSTSSLATGAAAAAGSAASNAAAMTGASGLSALKRENNTATHSTPSLPARFDPSHFGAALMSAAKDGVDRFGTPTLGGSVGGSGVGASAAGSRVSSPPPAAGAGAGLAEGNNLMAGLETAGAGLEGNLKSIGKFFRRDVTGGFGGFGRRAAGEGEGRSSLDRR
ncbi:hypothetical protein MBLNU230_g4997t1 [Neophaeotheca triangularis]